jgi:2TM domain
MTQGDATSASKKHAKDVRDFWYHLITFVFVNALLVIVDLRSGAGEQTVVGLDWAFWLILFWGFGLVAHAVYVFAGYHEGDDASRA